MKTWWACMSCRPTVYGDSHLVRTPCNHIRHRFPLYLPHLGYKGALRRSNITVSDTSKMSADERGTKIAKKARLRLARTFMSSSTVLHGRYHKAMEALKCTCRLVSPSRFGTYHPANKSVHQDYPRCRLRLCKRRLSVFRRSQVQQRLRLRQAVGPQYRRTSRHDTKARRTEAKTQPRRLRFVEKGCTRAHYALAIAPGARASPAGTSRCSTMRREIPRRTFTSTAAAWTSRFPTTSVKSHRAWHTADTRRQILDAQQHESLSTAKMGKSLGNFITLDEFFTGSHQLLEQAYSPMTIRFFILQAHYRGTVDFSNEALKSAERLHSDACSTDTAAYRNSKHPRPRQSTCQTLRNAPTRQWTTTSTPPCSSACFSMPCA